MENAKVTATPEENSRCRIDLHQVWSRSYTTVAQPQEPQEQQKASVDTTGVSRQRCKAAAGDAYPNRGSTAPAQDPVMRSFNKLEALLQTYVSTSRNTSPNQIDVSRGQPARPAMLEACNSQKERSSGYLQAPAFADVEVLRDAERAQHSPTTQHADDQQQHPQSGSKQQQSLPAQIAGHTPKHPEHKTYTQQNLFRPVVQQQRAASKHNAEPCRTMASSGITDPGRGGLGAEHWVLPANQKPRTPIRGLPAQQQAQAAAQGQPARAHSRLQQSARKASTVPCSASRTGGTLVTGAGPCTKAVSCFRPVTLSCCTGFPPHSGGAVSGSDSGNTPQQHSTLPCELLATMQALKRGTPVRAGEVEELNGLVTSLRSQCPVMDEPEQSGGTSDAAACSEHEHRPEKTPAESFTQVMQFTNLSPKAQ